MLCTAAVACTKNGNNGNEDSTKDTEEQTTDVVDTEADTETDPKEVVKYLPFTINEDGEDIEPLEDGFLEDGDAEPEEAEENGADDGVYVDLRTGEVFGDTDSYEDFIEPAANPKYSLPEEDDPVYDASEASYPEYIEGNEPSTETAEWLYDDTEAEPAEIESPVADDDGLAFELVYDDEIDDDYYDDSVRGEPAEDLPQEEPVTGEPADDQTEEKNVGEALSEYEQPVEDEQAKKYDGYEE
jgi:hypothetical protein